MSLPYLLKHHGDDHGDGIEGNSDVHGNGIEGNSDDHGDVIEGNSDVHGNGIEGNSDDHGDGIEGNSDVHGNGIEGNSDDNGDGIEGNSDVHGNGIEGNSDVHGDGIDGNSYVHGYEIEENSYVHNNEEFCFQTLFSRTSYSYRCCPCGFQHEFFQYISDKGELDQPMLENIVKNIKNGECEHIKGISSELIAKTSVSAHHVYAVVHRSDFNTVYDWKLFHDRNIHENLSSGIFNLTEYDLAILKNNNALLTFYNDIEINYDLVLYKCYYDIETLTMTLGKSAGAIRIEKTSIFTYCIETGKPEILKSILASGLEQIEQSYMRPLYELVFRNNEKEIEQILIDIDINVFEEMRDDGNFSQRISWTEPAIMYDRPDLLDKALSIMNTHEYMAFRQYLMEVAFVLQREDCKRVLSKHKLPDTEPCRLEIFDQVYLLLFLYEKYRYLRDEISDNLNMISHIDTIINVKWRCKYHPDFYRTQLQLFLFYSSNDLDLSVIKLLLKLGAQVDVNPSDGGLHFPSFQPLIHCLVNHTQYSGNLRPLVELLIFANPSTKLHEHVDERVQHLGLDFDISNYELNIMDTVNAVDMIPGQYITDGKQHPYSEDEDLSNPAHLFIVPLLIEAGFKFSRKVLREMIDRCEEVGIHPAERLYLQSCLENPRPLSHCCRGVLRQFYPGHQIHKFVRVVNLPRATKDFILLKPVLPSLQSFEL